MSATTDTANSCHGNTKDAILETVPCRSNQIKLLMNIFGEREHYTVPSVFIYGHTATGKSAVSTALLQGLKLPHVVVNCVECYTSRLLYEHVLNHISGQVPAASNDFTCYARCDNMGEFVRLLRQAVEDRGVQGQTIYIVLDKAERLRDMDMNLLPGLLRLQELTGLNVCVVLLSEIVWEKFRGGTGVKEPFIIHFPDYSKDDILEVLMRDRPSEYSENLYCSYLNLVLSVFYQVCRDLDELRHLAQLNFPKYVEPIKAGDATEENSRTLWRNIEPHLKKALQTVYLREVSSSQWERLQTENDDTASRNIQGLSSRVNIELPYYSKYLLIAAYLSSYNPASTDKRFFAKNAGRMSKRTKTILKKHRTSNQLLGPKPFPLDRLMAIFYTIVEDKVAPTANIFSQISSLVTLQLLAHIGGDDRLDSPKYKCLVSLDFIRGIGRQVNFDVVHYLYDYV